MKSYDELFDTSINNASIQEWKKNGGKVIGLTCCHTPEELFHAAGLLPIRIRATDCTNNELGETWMSIYSCPFSRDCTQYALDGTYSFLDGFVGNDGCMMAQRIYDNWAYNNKGGFHHFFLIPRLLMERGVEFYTDEINGLREQLEKFTGIKITDEKLRASIEVYNETRHLIRKLYELRKVENPVITGEETLKIVMASMSMPKEKFNTLLKEFLADAEKRAPLSGYRARVVVVGSAIDDPSFLKAIEDAGALIVSDVQCFGSSNFWDEVKMGDGDAVTELARGYLSRVVCPRMCNMHHQLCDRIVEMKEEFNADGVIYVLMTNCVLWGGERIFIDKLMQEKGIQCLSIDNDKSTSSTGQIATRVEAFVEVIEGAK